MESSKKLDVRDLSKTKTAVWYDSFKILLNWVSLLL